MAFSFGGLLSKVAGPLLSGGLQYLGGREQRQASSAISQKQMDFQERMYGQRYQLQMADMRKAGLNPILSYSQGPPGAPAGAGIPAQDMIGPAVNSAKQALRLTNELKQMKATLTKTHAEEDESRSRASLNTANMEKSYREINNLEKTWDILNTEATSAKNVNKLKDTEFGLIMDIIKNIMRSK